MIRGMRSLWDGGRVSLAVLAVLAFSSWAQAKAAQTQCAEPRQLSDGLAVAPAAAADFDPAVLCKGLAAAGADPSNLHAVLVARRGLLVAELYRTGHDRSIYSLFSSEVTFGPDTLHDMRSISKSVVALLIGIAAGEGRIDIHRPAIDFFPEFADLRTPERLAITVEHLLTMSSGLEWHETLAPGLSNDETRLYWDVRPLRHVMQRRSVATAGERFNYSGGSTALLAEILERATGSPLRTYARERLFAPLGIATWHWVASPYGRPLSFAGLRLTPRDLLRIGLMLLDGGRWNGRQIVPPAWVRTALAHHLPTSGGPAPGYGYQFWTGEIAHGGRPVAWAAALGNGGQRLFLVRELDLAVVVTAGAYNEAAIGGVTLRLFEAVVAAAR